MLNSSTSLPSITSPLLPFTTFTTTPPRNLTRISPKTLIKLYSRTSKTIIQASSSSESQSAAAVVEETSKNEFGSASDIVRNFYGGINEHHLDSVAELIAENCVYEDLVFPDPFVGRKAILEFFKKFTDSISKDLQFVIDDISGEDSLAVGVTWHLEWQGRPFPFSKGCSFYRLEVVNGKKQIIYGRDSVEPSVKLGETALVAIRGVTWLFQWFPQLAEQLR